MIIPSMPIVGTIETKNLVDEVWAVLRRYPEANSKTTYQMTTMDFISLAHGAWRAEHADSMEAARNPVNINCVDFAFWFLSDFSRDPVLRYLPKMYVSGYQWLTKGNPRHAFPLFYCYRENSLSSEKLLVYADPSESATMILPMAELRALDYLAVNAKTGIGGQFLLV